MLNAILWVKTTGSPWRKLPECYGCWQSAYARFRKWQADGVMEAVFQILSMFSANDNGLALNARARPSGGGFTPQKGNVF